MLRGISVLVVASMAMIFLKKKQYIHHFTALGVLFVGVLLVGVASFINEPTDGSDETTTILGVMLVIVA